MDVSRRSFLKSTALIPALGAMPGVSDAAATAGAVRPKKPAVVRGAFFYPPLQVVLDGKCEDDWHIHNWCTWPGNQYQPEQQQKKFEHELERISQGLDVKLMIDSAPIYTGAGISTFISEVAASKPDALLLFNFWNSFSPKIVPILDAFPGPIILYHPLGANHQLPPEKFRTAPRVQYIHSLENFDAIERGLRAVHAMARMKQSRVLRVSGQVTAESDEPAPFFNCAVHTVPADQFNNLFDETKLTDDLRKLARKVHAHALDVKDLADSAFDDAVRAHHAVLELMDRHEADAITIECLLLKHRKPCLSFAVNNGALVPCGCENDLNATLTLMLGANLFGRGGFQHNPEFDTEENLYFGSHCTCTTRLHGPAARPARYDLRPFFHQLPKSLALDVQWPEGEPVTLLKVEADEARLNAWSGTVVSSPPCPPAGGCATRVLVRLDGVDNVCDIYSGIHPVLYCGDFARHAKAFAKLYELELRTNA
jgi:hypothetical protein